MDVKKVLVVAASAAAVGGIAYLVWTKMKKSKDKNVVFTMTEEDIEKRVKKVNEKPQSERYAKTADPEKGEEASDEAIFVNSDAAIEQDVDDEMYVGKFELISMEQFEGIEGDSSVADYDKISATYFSDGTLVGDPMYGPLDIEDSVGSEAIKCIEANPYQNVIYVRNNVLGCDFEVVAVPERYQGGGRE